MQLNPAEISELLKSKIQNLQTQADHCGSCTGTCMGAPNSNGTCSSGKCVCTGQSCPNGCCDAMAQCKTPSATTCGTNGAMCVACANGKQCVNGACM